MADRPYNVLFLCTGNSARSILAERIISQWGRGRFRGFSAGSHLKGVVHPIALELLEKMNLPTEGLRSKSWDEFAAPGAPPLDFVFTVCDNAAGEVYPWPGQPMTAHWGVPDPAAVEGSEPRSCSDTEERKMRRGWSPPGLVRPIGLRRRLRSQIPLLPSHVLSQTPLPGFGPGTTPQESA